MRPGEIRVERAKLSLQHRHHSLRRDRCAHDVVAERFLPAEREMDVTLGLLPWGVDLVVLHDADDLIRLAAFPKTELAT